MSAHEEELIKSTKYLSALDWLYVQAPNYELTGIDAYKPGLENIKKLCEYFGNPQKDLKMIHIGGTNGKGSSCHILSSILQENNYKVGLFCSPHLVDFRERIKINSKLCEPQFVLDYIDKLKRIPSNIQASFFEFTTVMAFEYFKNQKVDFAVIEVGLGGRLDSTNIISPILSAITNVDKDHQNLLGEDLLSIAKEKAGIIKTQTPIIIGETHKEVQKLFIEKAKALNSEYHLSENSNYESDLKGVYQSKNLGFVKKICEVLKSKSITISEKSIVDGMQNVQKNTSFMGRWTEISSTPQVILDTAHNVAGIKQVFYQLQSIKKYKHIIMGFVNDKKLDEVFEILPRDYSYYFVKPQNIRGQNPENYRLNLEKFKINYKFFENTWEAYLYVKQIITPKELLFIGGSNFIVGDFLEKHLEN